MRIHEYLEIRDSPAGKVTVCRKCEHEFGPASQNYKLGALYRERDPGEMPLRGVRSGESSFVVYQEYLCPGCGTLLEVDLYSPQIDGDQDKVVWDIQIALEEEQA